MGLFNFVKDAGEKVWDAVAGNHTEKSAKLKEHIQKLGLPGADNVNIDVVGDKGDGERRKYQPGIEGKNSGGNR